MAIRAPLAALLMAILCCFSTVVTVTPAHAQAGVLTPDTLKSMLEGLGYEPTGTAANYKIRRTDNGTNVEIQFVLSSDKTKLGLSTYLGKVTNPAGVKAQQWLDLLNANADNDPDFFYFSRDDKELYLHRVIDNHALAPAFLKVQIDKFYQTVLNTSKLWAFTE